MPRKEIEQSLPVTTHPSVIPNIYHLDSVLHMLAKRQITFTIQLNFQVPQVVPPSSEEMLGQKLSLRTPQSKLEIWE